MKEKEEKISLLQDELEKLQQVNAESKQQVERLAKELICIQEELSRSDNYIRECEEKIQNHSKRILKSEQLVRIARIYY